MPYTKAIAASKVALTASSGFLYISCGLTLWSLVRLAPHLSRSDTELAPYCLLCVTLIISASLAFYTTTLAILCAVRGQTLLGGRTRSNGLALSVLAAVDSACAASTLALFAKANLMDAHTSVTFAFAVFAAVLALIAGQRLIRVTRNDTMPTPATFNPRPFSSLVPAYTLSYDGAVKLSASESRTTFDELHEKDSHSISEKRFGRSRSASPDHMVTVNSLRSTPAPLTTVSQRNSPSPSRSASPSRMPYVKSSTHYTEYASARRSPRSKHLAPAQQVSTLPNPLTEQGMAHQAYILPDSAPESESWGPATLQRWSSARSNRI